MQTLSPTISTTLAKPISPKTSSTETDYLPTISQSLVLQTALAGLDASLNDELDRYRHWQTNGQTISYLNPFRPRAVATQSIWTSPSMSEALLSPITPPVDSNNSDRRTIQMPVMPAMGTTSSPSINISSAELHKYRGLDTLDKIADSSDIENADLVTGLDTPFAYAQNADDFTSSAMAIDSPMMVRLPEPDDDEILQSFADDYTNSNQEPINQDTQFPTSSNPPQKSALRSLMNPVGIISLLLLLFSSAAIGYLMVDPSGVMKLLKPDAKPKAAQSNGTNSDLGKDINMQNQRKSDDTSLSFVPFVGDKAKSNQMVDGLNKNNKANTLNGTKNSVATPSNLFVSNNNSFNTPLRTVPSTSFPPLSVAPLPPSLAPLERSYNPAPESGRSYEPAASSPSNNESRNTSSSKRQNKSSTSQNTTLATPNRENKAAVSNPPSAEPSTPAYVAPRTNSSVKYGAPMSSAPANETATTSTSASGYRVIVENGYAASAQQIERDAYVRPSDGQVQVGSYRDANAAQQRIEQLRRQGIPARIE